MISKEEVQRIAKLARLELSGDEIKKMQKDLSDILDYFNVLKKAPTKPVEWAGSRQANKLREDMIFPRDAKTVERIIAAAPDKKDDYIKVKAIL